MTSRTRFLITAALVCHLLLVPSVVTSQLLFASEPTGAQSSLPSAPSSVREEEVTIRALQQEKDGVVYKLRGQAEIHYGAYILHADSVDYNSDTGEAIADGNVVLDGGSNDEHVEATHATYNIRAESGRFVHVKGTTGMQLRGKRMILTTENPFAFTGRVVEKTGPDHYLVYDGTITTCELPRPKWEFNAHKIIVEVGGNATIYHSTFRIEGVPVFYFPFATHPVEREPRQSGVLIQCRQLLDQGNNFRGLHLLGHQSQHGRHCRGRIFHPARLGAADRVPGPAQRKILYLPELLRSF